MPENVWEMATLLGMYLGIGVLAGATNLWLGSFFVLSWFFGMCVVWLIRDGYDKGEEE